MRRESSGNPNEISATDDWGLMQINACHHLRNALNPLINVAYALVLWLSDGWRDWTTAYDAPAWAEP
jgi:hypothetical protein